MVPIGVVDMVTGSQIKAARALLGWQQKQLADRTGLSITMIKRVETGFIGSISARAYFALVQGLEAHGIEFVGEEGVRLRKPE
jgi:transcriptional regulator with XRE-family HTH domain